MDSSQQKNVLSPAEIEIYIETLDKFDIKEIGSPRWSNFHERLSQLNTQSLLEASSQREEVVKNTLVTYGKIPVLIHEIVSLSVWKEKIFPIIIKEKFNPRSTIPLYTILYHEAILSTLLGTVFFHEDAIKSAQDNLIDLVDYAIKKILKYVERMESNQIDSKDISEFVKHEYDLEQGICQKLIAILVAIIEHLPDLSISVMHRLLEVHDVPMLFTKLLVSNIIVSPKERQELSETKINKTQGQLWIALLRLFTDPDCQKKYEINEFRKNQILKLKGLINDVLLDQIPCLEHLQRYLEFLLVSKPPSVLRPIIIMEQVAEIYESLIHLGGWKKIAHFQMNEYLNPSQDAAMDQAQRLVESYSINRLEEFLTDKPKCVVCGLSASNKCSRCKHEWYCTRKCQVQHWPKHKSACNLMALS